MLERLREELIDKKAQEDLFGTFIIFCMFLMQEDLIRTFIIFCLFFMYCSGMHLLLHLKLEMVHVSKSHLTGWIDTYLDS